jgi:hypothetical protein
VSDKIQETKMLGWKIARAIIIRKARENMPMMQQSFSFTFTISVLLQICEYWLDGNGDFLSPIAGMQLRRSNEPSALWSNHTCRLATDASRSLSRFSIMEVASPVSPHACTSRSGCGVRLGSGRT